MAVDTENVWQDIELTIYPDPFFTSCQIYSMKKKAGSKNLLKQKAPFKWVSTDIITATSPDVLKGETSFSNYLLIDDGYSKLPKCYGMERINTE